MTDFLLLETGGYLLLETGDKIILEAVTTDLPFRVEKVTNQESIYNS